MPPERRRELYGAVGGAFEAMYAASIDDHLELLAHYFARSHDLQKALDYLERAGQRAAGVDATSNAVELWRRAVKVAEKLEDENAQRRLNARIEALDAAGSEVA
jgi:hypothetical protein